MNELDWSSLSSVEGLRAAGFEGFETIEHLRASARLSVPKSPGVYLVLRDDPSDPEFLQTGTGGYFKRKDPNVSLEKLRQNWIDKAIIVYVGCTERTLYVRIGELLKFGQGKPVGHRGGRLIWQLKDAEKLQVCWYEMEEGDPDTLKSACIEAFANHYGGMPPFACKP